MAAVIGDPRQQARAEALWGLALDAPVAVHDAGSSRTLRIGADGARADEVALPDGQPPANTCIVLDGVPTALLVRPLPGDAAALARLLWHERWHCAQAALGLASYEADNAHLDSEDGRMWLRLEMRALARALQGSDGNDARGHARAALAFRRQRAEAAGHAAPTHPAEAALELNEGLAEYTGHRAAAGGDAGAAIVRALVEGDSASSHVRTFAYLTGPAYGVLLDRWRPDWRKAIVRERDLAALLAPAVGSAAQVDATASGHAYGADEVRAEERDRAAERLRRRNELHRRYVAGPVVALRLQQPQVSFDPRAVFPLGADGTFYAPVTLSDAWGALEAPEGALLASNWTAVHVPAHGIAGCREQWQAPGWRLRLKPGWTLLAQDGGWRLAQAVGRDCAAPAGDVSPSRAAR